MIQLPRAWWWDHNAYYHPWLFRQLPERFDSALDIGCGAGRLARLLGERASRVDAIDVSEAMVEKARSLSASRATTEVRYLAGDVLTAGLATYDVVTSVSSLHHLELRAGLARMAELVRPGGTLAIVGHYHGVTVSDNVLGLAALPANAVVGAQRAVRGRAGKPDDEEMPVRDPDTTLAEIRTAAAELTPGARIRRRLFWRYTLVWQRPG